MFNGVHNGMVKKPLAAKPGERVRLYVLNVGPSKTSSFHVVGTIFDRVWIEGNPDNQFRGMQTVLLGSSNSAIVEFMIPEAGSYIMVDHHFANASQGAIGLVSTAAQAAGAGARAPQHAGLGDADRPGGGRRQAGLREQVPRLPFDRRGQEARPRPRRRDQAPQRRVAHALAEVAGEDAATDADAKAMLKEYNNLPMPNQNLTEAEIRQYLKYFEWIDAQGAGAH